MKSMVSRQLAKTLKSGPEAAKPGNEGFVKGCPYEQCHFRAACQNLQILAWSRHAWRRKVCKEISLCLEGIVFMRRSFYKSFIAMRGGFTTRFPGLGQRPGTDYFHKEILSQIFHFQAWRLQGQISRFGPPVWKWLWFFWKSLNSKLSCSSVKFQGFCNGLEIFFVHEYISLEMTIHYQTYWLPQTAKPGTEGFVKCVRIWGSVLLSEAAVKCNVYYIQILFDTTQSV